MPRYLYLMALAAVAVAFGTFNAPTRATTTGAGSRATTPPDLGPGTPGLEKVSYKLTDEGFDQVNKDKGQIQVTVTDVELLEGDLVALTLTGTGGDSNSTVVIGDADDDGSGDSIVLVASGQNLKNDKNDTVAGFRVNAKYNTKQKRLNIKLTKGPALDDVPVLLEIPDGKKNAKANDVTIDVTVHFGRVGSDGTTDVTATKSFAVQVKASNKTDQLDTSAKEQKD